jgi:spermidine synthase
MPTATGPRPVGALLPLLTVTTFTAAALMFLVEPMVAKMLLPLLGGTADVWNTAMVFFQSALLAGYAFAHLTLSRLGVRRQRALQAAVVALPLLALPVAVPAGWVPQPGSSPALWTLAALTVMVGAPFLALSTSSPTLQRWFSVTGHPHAADPYFLYAAGNTGSLLALLSYPFVFERLLPLDQQSRLWSFSYAVVAVLTLATALVLRPSRADPVPAPRAPSAPPARPVRDGPDERTRRRRLRWVGLAAVPSSLLLGVTRHLATDVASLPLLWIVPLAIYLASFVIAFGRWGPTAVDVAGRALKLLAIPLVLSFFAPVGSLWVSLVLHLAAFAAAAVVAHGLLAADRPPTEGLTGFYLLLSLGGVIGGVTTALLAPLLFTSVLEYPIAIVAALALLPPSAFSPASPLLDRFDPRVALVGSGGLMVLLAGAAVAIRAAGTQRALVASILVAAAGAVGAFVLARTAAGYAAALGSLLAVALLVPANPTLYQARTFFGVHRVYAEQAAGGRHVLLSGTTVHGIEEVTGPAAGEPTAYYHRSGPIGQYFATVAPAGGAPTDVGVIGLGSGALAAYGRPGDHHTYYEIDEAVMAIAADPALFTFVPRSPATIRLQLGDGRRMLDADTGARYDTLVVDAFSGDSIPTHLMTDEAMDLYLDRLRPGGVIAFHVSNRYFDLAPVLARLASERGLAAAGQEDTPTPDDEAEGKMASTWVLLSPDPAALARVTAGHPWQPLIDAGTTPLWTDTYTDLLGTARW